MHVCDGEKLNMWVLCVQGAEDSVRRGVDLEALQARGRGRVVEGGVNLFLIQSHMRRRVLREMLEKRACMDGSLCLVRCPSHCPPDGLGLARTTASAAMYFMRLPQRGQG